MNCQIKRGTLVEFCGSWGSGVGSLLIKDSVTDEVEAVPCENGPTVRALEAAFGDTITNGHTADGDGYKGQEVYWAYDELGLLLGGFVPVDEAPEELVEAYAQSDHEC